MNASGMCIHLEKYTEWRKEVGEKWNKKWLSSHFNSPIIITTDRLPRIKNQLEQRKLSGLEAGVKVELVVRIKNLQPINSLPKDETRSVALYTKSRETFVGKRNGYFCCTTSYIGLGGPIHL